MLIKLAWRNIWRNKRRSIITILAVTFAVMLSIAMRGLQLGTYDLNIRNAVELFSGYLQIQREGYQTSPTLHKSFRFDKKIRKICEDQPQIIGYTPRIVGDGLISFRDNSLGAAILAIDPQTEPAVSTLLKKLNAGQMFASDTTDEIVVGYKLLKNLKTAIGDTVVVLSQGFDGSLGNLKFRIIGTLKTGAPELDQGAVVMGLSTAQNLLSMYGRISMIAISLARLNDIDAVQKQLNDALSGSKLTTLRWNQIMPELQQAIEMDNIGGKLFLAILLLVVAFGITNTVLMSVTERFQEFGVTLAIGMPQKKLVSLVFIETILMTLVGLAFGNLLAMGINYYLTLHPIVFGGDYAKLYQEYGFLPQLQSTLQPDIFINITVVVLIIALIACLYPLAKVYRLAPLKGIRYT